MELFQLETFLAVAEEKSFSRAATRMHRTQSAVSQTISKLEDELGERLFDRSSRDGSLTDAGQVLVIAANEFTARYLLPVLHIFHRLHPMIRIQVMRTLAREVPGQVLNHDVEFGVVSFRVDDAELTSHMLYRDELALIVYPRHPMAKAGEVGIKDLGAENFIAHTVLSPYREKVIQAFKKHHTPLHMNVELPTIEDIKQFVRMENGVALVPLIAVEHEIASGELVHVPCLELAMERKLRLVYRTGTVLSHAGQAFLKTCRAVSQAPGSRYLMYSER